MPSSTRSPSTDNETRSSQAASKDSPSCSRCGFCLAACPVYDQLRSEITSPRGKVQLARQIEANQLPISSHMQSILSSCLLCGSCTAACPSGVQGAHIFSELRWQAARRFGIGWKKKIIYQVLATQWKLHGSARLAAWVRRHFGRLIDKGGSKQPLLAAMPPFNRQPFAKTALPVNPAKGRRVAKVLYFHGCATNYLFDRVGQSVVNVLTRMGVDVHIPSGQGCCGIPIFLSGARELAFANIKDVITRFRLEDADAVIVDCATCGAALRQEYVPLLEALAADGHPVSQGLIAQARQLAAHTFDVMEFIAQRFDELPQPAANGKRLRVTYHDPCHLSKGQGVSAQLRPILQGINGVDYVEMTDANMCCGGGGSFQLDHPETSAAITERKVSNIRQTHADAVATGCPGCRLTIGSRLNQGTQTHIDVVHPVEIIDNALTQGGTAIPQPGSGSD